jgi:antitoxin HicB
MTEFVFPARLEHDPESGETIASFPDVPGAHTSAPTPNGDQTTLRAEAVDCLDAAVCAAIADGDPLLEPSPPGAADLLVPLPLRTAAKLALHSICRRQRIGPSALAQRARIDVKEAHRLLDPRHASKIDRLADVLSRLGGPTLTLSVQPAPADDPLVTVAGYGRVRQSAARAMVGHGLAVPTKGGYALTPAGRLYYGLPAEPGDPHWVDPNDTSPDLALEPDRTDEPDDTPAPGM